MGKRNQQKRAAKKKARQQRGPAPPSGGGFRPDSAEFLPPSPGLVADAILDSAEDTAGGTGADTAAARDEVARLLCDRFPPRLVGAAAAMATEEVLTAIWQAGWLPEDLHEVAQRHGDDTVVALLRDAVAADTARYAPATVHPRWADQVRSLAATVWWRHDEPHLPQRARHDGVGLPVAVAGVIGLLAILMRLPRLPVLVALPGTAQATGSPVSGIDSRVLNRVRGLLAKAESTEYPDEAEALSAKAQELMNRHAFHRALLDADAERGPEVISVRLWLRRPYADAKSHLVATVAGANRCRAVSYPHLGFVALVGHPVDLEIAELLATSLLVQATRAVTAEGTQVSRAGQSRTTSFRRSFLVSYAGRIGERLRGADTVAREAAADDRLLPVLANRSQAVDAAFDAMFDDGDLRLASASATNTAGWHAGRDAADRADIDIRRREVAT